jgi:adenine-specific DNA-methyltransferase
MEKLKLHSPDLTQSNIEKLAQLFPNCVAEALDADGTVKRGIDFDQLRQELTGSIVEGPQERYQLNWPGKREALLTANAPIAKTLRPCREESVDFDTTQNLFIEGDNLDALKLLQETYLNKVKMIYIDPPYNTGNDFIYEDDFAENTNEFLKKSNQVDLDGRRLISNTLANGRFHSDWMSMIYQRLKLARNLLRDDGLIFISISDEEVCNLGKICDEIFGERNFIAKLIWNTEGHTDNQYDIKVNHEYILVYAKTDTAKLGYVIDPNTRQESNLWKGFAENSITKNGPANPPSEITLPKGFPCLAENLSQIYLRLPLTFGWK